jgi:DNA-binding HxlR family transcriptional regulator
LVGKTYQDTVRTYNDLCGIARALDVVGDRWALLVVRELLLGPKRFTDLRGGLPGASPDMLSARLRELEQAGVVRRGTLPPPAASRVYELTERGHGLAPVLRELGRWGSLVPPARGTRLGVDAAVLALPSLFDAEAAGDLDARFGLVLDGEPFTAEVSGGRLLVGRGAPPGATATLTTDPMTFAALLWQGLDLVRAARAGDAEVEGDRRAIARLLELVPLPAESAA